MTTREADDATQAVSPPAASAEPDRTAGFSASAATPTTTAAPDAGPEPAAAPATARGPDAAPDAALGPTPPATDAGAHQAEPSVQVRALKVIGSVVAPAALLTALMYFFGLLHAYWFFGRFGVDYTIMGLTTQDYLVRSADGLFVPLTAVAAVWLAALWLVRWLPASFLLTRVRELVRPAVVDAVAVLVGMTALGVAVAGLLDPSAFTSAVGVPGLCLVGAVILLAAASRSGRRRHPLRAPVIVAEWMAIFLLVSTGLYWATSDYSASVGTRRGDDVIAALRTWPDAVVYSEKSLNLSLPGVHERPCRAADGAFAYRYDGLKLIVQSGGQLFFLPADWVDGAGTAVVLPRTDTLRLEFTGPGRSANGTC